MAGEVKKGKSKIQRICPGNQRFVLVSRFAFVSFLTVTLFTLTGMPVFASDIFGTAKNAMQTVYTDVAGIATVAAVVCAAVCLFLMKFSKSGRTVDESRAWLKRIVVCWAALMTLGAIALFFVVAAKPVVNYILKFSGTPYQWVVGTEIKVESFSGFVSALEV